MPSQFQVPDTNFFVAGEPASVGGTRFCEMPFFTTVIQWCAAGRQFYTSLSG
jgi:hypothetical protein